MNEMSLSRLYRRLVSARPHPEMDDGELVSAVSDSGAMTAPRRETIARQLADSPGHADLARLLGALKPDSAALASGINAYRHPTHPLRTRELRTAAGARRSVEVQRHRVRWAGGFAACMALALGVFSWQGQQTPHWNNVVSAAHSVSSVDRIFTTRDRIFAASDDTPHASSGAPSDELFRANFAIGG